MTEEEEEEAKSFFSVVFDSKLSLAVPWSIEFCLISFALQHGFFVTKTDNCVANFQLNLVIKQQKKKKYYCLGNLLFIGGGFTIRRHQHILLLININISSIINNNINIIKDI